MPNVKLVVMYPRPKDIEVFEKNYLNEHVPLAVSKLVAQDQDCGDQGAGFHRKGHLPFYRIAEVYFRSMAGSGSMCRFRWREGNTCPHAVTISSWWAANFLGS